MIQDNTAALASETRYDDLDEVDISVDEVTNTTTISGVITKFSADPNNLPLNVYNNDSLQVTLANGDILYPAVSYIYDADNQRYDASTQINTCEPIASVRVKGNEAGIITIEGITGNYYGVADNTILSQQNPQEISSDLGAQVDVGTIDGGSAETVSIGLTAQLSPALLSQSTLVLSDGSNTYTGVYDPIENVFVFTTVPLGTYDCTLQWSFCSVTNTVIVDNTTGLPGTSQATFALYPNPAESQLTVHGQGPAFRQYVIRSVTGQLILQGTLQGNTIDIGGLAPGAYSIGLFDNAGEGVRGRFVKE